MSLESGEELFFFFLRDKKQAKARPKGGIVGTILLFGLVLLA